MFNIQTADGEILKDCITNEEIVFETIEEAEDYCEYWELPNSFIVKQK